MGSVYHFGVRQDRQKDIGKEDSPESDVDATENMKFESIEDNDLMIFDWFDCEDFEVAGTVDIPWVDDADIVALNGDHVVQPSVLTMQRNSYTLNKFNSISSIWTCVSP